MQNGGYLLTYLLTFILKFSVNLQRAKGICVMSHKSENFTKQAAVFALNKLKAARLGVRGRRPRMPAFTVGRGAPAGTDKTRSIV